MNSPIRTWFKQHPLIAFFTFSYAIAWTIWILAGLLAPDLLTTLALVGVWAPTVSAILLTGIISGRKLASGNYFGVGCIGGLASSGT